MLRPEAQRTASRPNEGWRHPRGQSLRNLRQRRAIPVRSRSVSNHCSSRTTIGWLCGPVQLRWVLSRVGLDPLIGRWHERPASPLSLWRSALLVVGSDLLQTAAHCLRASWPCRPPPACCPKPAHPGRRSSWGTVRSPARSPTFQIDGAFRRPTGRPDQSRLQSGLSGGSSFHRYGFWLPGCEHASPAAAVGVRRPGRINLRRRRRHQPRQAEATGMPGQCVAKPSCSARPVPHRQ